MRIKRFLFAAAVFSMLLPLSVQAAVYQDISEHPDKEYITEYSEAGLVNGYPDGTFRPDALITRAEVTALLDKLQLPERNGKSAIFSDVPKDEWYYDMIYSAIQSGIVSGYEDNTFQPKKNISRYEAISIVSRMVKDEDISDIQLPYADRNSIPAWANASVKKLYAARVIDSYNGNVINGNAAITRAEMVRMLDKMMRIYAFETDQITVVQTPVKDSSDEKKTEAVVQNTTIPHDVLGYLTIEAIGIEKYPVKDGADLETIQTAIGHFAETPLWDGNVGFCAHNRDYKYDFRNLKNIEKGDTVVYETRFGTRTYRVNEIKAIAETDWDDLLEVAEVNQVTMITCIEDQPTKRLMVQASEIV